jgi:hypothetical protein
MGVGATSGVVVTGIDATLMASDLSAAQSRVASSYLLAQLEVTAGDLLAR